MKDITLFDQVVKDITLFGQVVKDITLFDQVAVEFSNDAEVFEIGIHVYG